MSSNSRQGGWLVMEALVAIVISAMLTAGAVSLFGAYERSIYKERVSVAVVQLGENIKKGFSTRSDYTGVSESAALDLGLVPNILVSSGPDGADLSITPGPAGTFDIALTFGGEVSARGWCADLLPDGERTWVSTGAGTAAGAGMQPGMSVGDAMAACDGATVFTFRGM